MMDVRSTCWSNEVGRLFCPSGDLEGFVTWNVKSDGELFGRMR